MKTLRDSLVLVLLAVIIATYAIGASFGAGIKSIQQGTGTEAVGGSAVDTVNITITAVTLAKTEVQAWCASNAGLGYYGIDAKIAPVLTTTTNLSLFMSVGTIGGTITYTWQVIEYY